MEGIKKYHNVICNFCNIRDFDNISKEELDGYYGVAILLAFLDRVDADLSRLIEYLKISDQHISHLADAFNRLKVNNIFSAKYNARYDKVLLGKNTKNTKNISARHQTKIAWGIIAGISSGFAGIK